MEEKIKLTLLQRIFVIPINIFIWVGNKLQLEQDSYSHRLGGILYKK